MSPAAAVPTCAPTAGAVMARAGGENFSVATRVLPRSVRAHLLAIYGYARLVDELGDSFAGDRLAALDWLEGELDRSLAGEAEHPLLVRVGQTASECGLERGPFVRLIEANRQDQRITRYEDWAQLRSYCSLSADPVGELVLGVLGLATPERIALSDAICTALQLTEHCQDVAEDYSYGRIYLPAEDMRRFHCSEDELGGATASAALRAVIAFEVARARALLGQGMPLIAELRGRSKLAVAGFASGGHAALEAIGRARYDVLAQQPRAGRLRRARALAGVLRASAAS